MGALIAASVTPASAALYEVGEGKPFGTIGAVPWESLQAGDTVLIYWRPAPYNEKWVLARQGTPTAPITVRGVPGPGGDLPIIDGNGATTRLQLDYWSESRGVIKVGGSSVPADVMPQHVVIENLEIRSARPPYAFTDDAGSLQSYPNNAASIYIEKGEHITIRNCVTHDSGNGIFVASSDSAVSRSILIEGNHIYDNGNNGSIFEHNTYTAAIDIVYQYNRFGPLRAGAGGNNLKDRSAGLVIRYNWIESGNRQLDLVDAEDSGVIESDPAYRTTWVYGNVLIEPDGAGNRQIVHYGGDSGNSPGYRKGTLHFYHNTVVSTRAGITTLLRLSTDDEHCDARNNIVYVTAAGSNLALLDADGMLDITHNWFKPGWRYAYPTLDGTVNDDGTTIEGQAPGFANPSDPNYHLTALSGCVDQAGELHPTVLPAHDVTSQYLPHQAGTARLTTGMSPDLGAFEIVRGDADHDGDVDLADWVEWPNCAAGPDVNPPTPDCVTFDFDADDDVDLEDYAELAIPLAEGGRR
jgi:hypothetical protein